MPVLTSKGYAMANAETRSWEGRGPHDSYHRKRPPAHISPNMCQFMVSTMFWRIIFSILSSTRCIKHHKAPNIKLDMQRFYIIISFCRSFQLSCAPGQIVDNHCQWQNSKAMK